MTTDATHVRTRDDLSKPPGPEGLPLLGSLLDVRRDPLGFLLQGTRKYGDILEYRIASYVSYLVNHPEYIQHVLQMNHRNYSKENFDYEMLKPVVGDGLLTSNGDFWLRQRRLIQPAFHRKRIAEFGTIMTDAASAMANRWAGKAARGEPVGVAEEMMRVTLQIVGLALFSRDISGEANVVGSAFATVNKEISDRFKMVLPVPLYIPTPRNRRLGAAIQALDEVVLDIIEDRRHSGERRDDLLDMLLAARDEESGEGMTDRQLRDEVMTLMLAGHETTANALTWTWYLLSTHPQVARRLRDELDRVLGGRAPTMEDLPALEYTEMVIQEAMRLYPPAWMISRTALEDDEIGGYPVPAGTIVSLSPYTMHRHPGFWENPEGFDPDRFSPGRSEGRHKFAYFPFGGGPRLCIGNNFAMMEAQLILATIAQRYRLELVPGHPVEPEPLITLRPKYGMRMTLHTA